MNKINRFILFFIVILGFDCVFSFSLVIPEFHSNLMTFPTNSGRINDRILLIPLKAQTISSLIFQNDSVIDAYFAGNSSDGTPSNPYILEGLNIRGSMEFINTTRYIECRNIEVTTENTFAIWLSNCSNIYFANISCHDNLEGFSFEQSSNISVVQSQATLNVINSTNIIVENNSFYQNNFSMYLNHVSNSTVCGNSFINSSFTANLGQSLSIFNNTFNNSNLLAEDFWEFIPGFGLFSSNNTTLKSNIFINVPCFFGYNNNTSLDSTNLVNGHPILLYEDLANITISGVNNPGYVVIDNCMGCTFRDFSSVGLYFGMNLEESRYNSIVNCTVAANQYGIMMSDSTHNNITDCRIRNSQFANLYLENCTHDIFQSNDISYSHLYGVLINFVGNETFDGNFLSYNNNSAIMGDEIEGSLFVNNIFFRNGGYLIEARDSWFNNVYNNAFLLDSNFIIYFSLYTAENSIGFNWILPEIDVPLILLGIVGLLFGWQYSRVKKHLENYERTKRMQTPYFRYDNYLDAMFLIGGGMTCIAFDWPQFILQGILGILYGITIFFRMRPPASIKERFYSSGDAITLGIGAGILSTSFILIYFDQIFNIINLFIILAIIKEIIFFALQRRFLKPVKCLICDHQNEIIRGEFIPKICKKCGADLTPALRI